MPIDIDCPHCEKQIKAPDAFAGKRVKCPGCKQPVELPQPGKEIEDYTLSDLGLDEPIKSGPPTFVRPKHAPDPLPANEDSFVDVPFATRSAATPRNDASAHLPEKRSYPALNMIRIALLVLAGLVAVSWLISILVVLVGVIAGGSQDAAAGAGLAMGGMMYLALTFFSGAIACCVLVAGAELIKVVIDIQENTLAAARK